MFQERLGRGSIVVRLGEHRRAGMSDICERGDLNTWGRFAAQRVSGACKFELHKPTIGEGTHFVARHVKMPHCGPITVVELSDVTPAPGRSTRDRRSRVSFRAWSSRRAGTPIATFRRASLTDGVRADAKPVPTVMGHLRAPIIT